MQEPSVQALNHGHSSRQASYGAVESDSRDNREEISAIRTRPDRTNGSDNIYHSDAYMNDLPQFNGRRPQGQVGGFPIAGYPGRRSANPSTRPDIRRMSNSDSMANHQSDEPTIKFRKKLMSLNTKQQHSGNSRYKYSVPRRSRQSKGWSSKVKQRVKAWFCCHWNNSVDRGDSEPQSQRYSSETTVSISNYTFPGGESSITHTKRNIPQSHNEQFQRQKNEQNRNNSSILVTRERPNENQANTNQSHVIPTTDPEMTHSQSRDLSTSDSVVSPKKVKFDLRIDSEGFFEESVREDDSTSCCQFYEGDGETFDLSSQESIPGLQPRLTRTNTTCSTGHLARRDQDQMPGSVGGRATRQDRSRTYQCHWQGGGLAKNKIKGTGRRACTPTFEDHRGLVEQTYEQEEDREHWTTVTNKKMERTLTTQKQNYRGRQKDPHSEMIDHKPNKISTSLRTVPQSNDVVLKKKRSQPLSDNPNDNIMLTSESSSGTNLMTIRAQSNKAPFEETSEETITFETHLNEQLQGQKVSPSSSSNIEARPSSSNSIYPNTSSSESTNNVLQKAHDLSARISQLKPRTKCSRSSRRPKISSSCEVLSQQRVDGGHLSPPSAQNSSQQTKPRSQKRGLVRGPLLTVLAVLAYVFIMAYFFV